jgi:acyl-coenzyme A thioesterase 9
MKRLVGYDSTWGKAFIDRSMISSEFQKSNKPLEKRRMKDSYAEAIIPLGNEPLLRNRYVNFRKTVRFGRLLEDMDTMAVHISYLHNLSQNIMVNNQSVSPIVIVTALVDRIHVINNDISIDKNVKMSGFTSWVGKSSAEISMKLEQESNQGTWLPLVDAKFLVCARDVNNETSAIMNPLEVVTDEEKAIFESGESESSTFNILFLVKYSP